MIADAIKAKLAEMDAGARHVAPSTIELITHLGDTLDKAIFGDRPADAPVAPDADLTPAPAPDPLAAGDGTAANGGA